MPPLTAWLTPKHTLLLIGAAAVIWMLYEYLHRRQHRLAALLAGTSSGLAALLLLHFFGARLGIALPLTLYTLGVSAVAGIPGVLLLIVMQILEL